MYGSGLRYNYYPCSRPKVAFSNTKLRYIKCMGINENPSDEERNEYYNRFKNIPCYHIHRVFSDLDAVSLFVKNEILALDLIKKTYPVGPCYVLIGRVSNGIDAWILFPNFVKNKVSVPNVYTLALYHQWTHLLVNHPFYNAPYECGLPTQPIQSSSFNHPTPLSHCPNVPVTKKAPSAYSYNVDVYGSIYCNQYMDYYFQPCGCANVGGCSYPNMEMPDHLPNNYIWALYEPNPADPFFASIAHTLTGLNRSYMINGQEVTVRSYTWILSENGNARMELHNDGIYIYVNGTVIWSFYASLDPKISQILLEGTTLKLMAGGITRWQKNFLTGDSTGTSPYVLQLTNEGRLQIVDAKGIVFG